MTILTMSAGLFFVFVFYIRFFTDGFFKWNLWFGKNDVYFIAFFQLAYYDIQKKEIEARAEKDGAEDK